jgi:hypothetical protein
MNNSCERKIGKLGRNLRKTMQMQDKNLSGTIFLVKSRPAVQVCWVRK